jgi:hypothetical protein
MAGRVDFDPSDSRKGDCDPRLVATAGRLWTLDRLQDRLVDTVHLWRRMPSGGPSPIAKDGPWHLIRAEWGDYADPDAAPRKLPLTRAEYAQMMEASEWLGLVPERDRRLVVLAVTELARGAAQVPWLDLRARMGVRFGADGLRKRYSRALTRICNVLNRGNLRGNPSRSEK